MDILADFSKTYTFKRFAAPSVTKGRMDAKVFIDNDPATGAPWSMEASVQSLKYSEVMVLPEGLRFKDSVKIYTTTQLQVADPQNNTLGDRFEYKGKIYEIMMTVDWTDYDLAYFKFIGILVTD